jgi:ABC-type dipeptide/oligopeptide/nickel transport system permease subunit
MWLLMTPTAVLVTLLISINMVGEALRQAFDPRAG